MADIIQSAAAREIDLRAIVAVLRRQTKVIAYTTLSIFALAAIFLIVVHPTYTASAIVMVDPDPKNILDTGTRYPSSSGRENAKVDSEVEILRSDAVALAVIDEQGLARDQEFGPHKGFAKRFAEAIGIANAAPNGSENPAARTLAAFKDAIHVRRKGLTYLISVSATSRDPQKAANLANKTAQAYISQQVDTKVAATLGARDVLLRQIEQSRDALAAFEAQIDTFIAQNLDASPTISDSAALTGLRHELTLAEDRARRARQAQQSALEQIRAENWPALAQSLGDETLSEIDAQRQGILDGLAAGTGATAEQSFEIELARLDRQLSERTATGLDRIDAQIEQSSQNVAELRGKIRSSVLKSDLSPELLTGIYALQQEANIARAQYQNLLSRMRDLETRARIQIADSRIVSPAIAPIDPSFPNRNLVFLVAMAASLGLGISLAFLKEFYIGGVTSATQLTDLLQTPAAGVIPLAEEPPAARKSQADQIVEAPLSGYAEAIRKLRATIDQSFRFLTKPQGADVPGRGKVILFTSAMPDEGKTTTALALARTYAIAGRKTLLIDADLRKPSLHRHLGFEPQTGFLDYLRNTQGDELRGSFYARDPVCALALIMGCARSEFPTDQLLTSSRFEQLLSQARDVYDVIIIDSPPLLPVVDARYIAHYADAVVLLVKWAATSQSDLRAAAQPLIEAMDGEAAFLPVLNQVPERRNLPHYGYGGYGPAYSAGT